jgi:hypothetical protein
MNFYWLAKHISWNDFLRRLGAEQLEAVEEQDSG